ncbi:MAG: 30S ribosomal protein S9 [Elusimicrobia bacterium]|nr:30S ribosomal protein S9 [Elusimicrobiota bacterium]
MATTTVTSVSFPLWTTGRRKESVARVRVIQGTGQLLINNKSVNEYFGGHPRAKADATAPLHHARGANAMDFHITVVGGGVTGQSGAVRHGIARAIVALEPNLRTILHKEGLLTRDPRMVERKKPGQPKARRRFQHSKR